MTGAELLAELEAMPSAKWTEGPTALDVEAEIMATIHRHMIEDAEAAFWASIAAREAGSGTIGPVEALE